MVEYGGSVDYFLTLFRGAYIQRWHINLLYNGATIILQ